MCPGSLKTSHGALADPGADYMVISTIVKILQNSGPWKENFNDR